MSARWLALVLFASCGGEVVSPAPKSFDLGDGTIARSWKDGRFEIRRDGNVIVSSANLLSRHVDVESPDAWHDPKKTDQFPFEPVTDITIDAPEPGVLHVGFGDRPAALVRMTLDALDDFYTGLGERFDHVNAKGTLVGMQMELDIGSESGTTERHVPVPFLVSPNGWGVFIATREAGAFDVASTHPESVTATFEGRSIDAWFFVHRDPIEVVSKFVRRSGLPRTLPRWALGPMLWHNEWTSQAELLAVANEIRKRHVPTTTLWIDNPWQTSYNTFRFDPMRFPDAPGMMSELSKLGYRTMAWSTPYLEIVNGAPKNEAQSLFLQSQDLLVQGNDGKPLIVPGFDSKNGLGMIDFTNAAARAFWSDLARRAVTSGFSGFKLDYGEDLVPTLLGARLPAKLADGTTSRDARKYPVQYHRAYHEALGDDGVTLVRASTWGGASQADIIWPGDLDNGFEKNGDPIGTNSQRAVGGLPAVVVAAQSLAVSGFPSFGSDTGGYRRGKPTKEALLRWSAHTALSVVMQLGGGGDSHDPWTYDEDASQLYTKLATLHQSLVPYLSGILKSAETLGVPTIRPLPLAFPNDMASRAAADTEYMLGPDLLVACVIAPNVQMTSVHLPPGEWIPWDGSTPVHGDVAVPAPLGKPIAFVRAGGLIPLLPENIDTLAASSDANVRTWKPGSWEARAFVRGNARATLDDGAAIEILDANDGIHVRFWGKELTARLELALRPITTISGAPTLASETLVRSSSSSAATLFGTTVVLKIVGNGEVVLK